MLAKLEVALYDYDQKQAVLDNNQLAKTNPQLKKLFDVLENILLDAESSIGQIQALFARIVLSGENLSEKEFFEDLPILESCVKNSDIDFNRKLLQPLFDVKKVNLFNVNSFCFAYVGSRNVDLSEAADVFAEILDFHYLEGPRLSLLKGLHEQASQLAMFEKFGFQPSSN